MIDWSKGYSSDYYMTTVDPVTWRDGTRINLTGGSIKREIADLMESATIDCESGPQFIEKWVRVYLDVNQNGIRDHIALFTGLATSPSSNIEGRFVSNSLECYSVLKPASDIYLLRGWYAQAGLSGGSVIKDLLSVVPAPIKMEENSPVLKSNIIAEDGETRLSMVEYILDVIDWIMQIEGDGTINIKPRNQDVAATYDAIDFDVIENQVQITEDWFNCPNVFMAISDDLTAIARDDSPDSIFSTVNRGREVWVQESGCDLADETIEQYAKRRLKQEQNIFKDISYDRRFVPNVYPGDIVRIKYPEQGLDGLFTIQSQSIEISHSARTSEEAYQ